MDAGYPNLRSALRRRELWLALVLTAGLSAALLAAEPDTATLPPAVSRAVDFAADVEPIFAKACYECHGAKKQKSDYRLDEEDSALKGGSIGGAVAPGKSADSLLVHYVAGIDEEMKMPPKGPALTAEQVGILRAWIDQGAKWPDATGADGQQRDHWSLKSLTKPALPDVKDKQWARTPVDSFILATLERKGMTPSRPADKRTLIRRVTFDLIGLPPTPQEIDAFLADESPGAYEKVVDRLLASPRYGERWARHWMDVVHYAETHGHDEDKPRPNAWPYRDYLIRSFNEDKPYARFVEEQLAGDVLYPDDPQALVATAFVAVGPWDQSSQMGIQDETLDKKVARYLDRDDMIWTTMSTFSSATVHCARCHNHKFDPIPTADYYALQAVFAGVDRVDRPYDPDPKVHAARKELLARKVELERSDYPRAMLLDAAVQAKVAEWERSLGQGQAQWVVLEPVEYRSADGATLAKQPDGSLLAGGTRPEKDTYTITAETDVKGITAVRLEVLTDDSLPQKGPGRAENGNLHLSEFKLLASPTGGGTDGKPAKSAPVGLQNPTADFDQQDWEIVKALDGNPDTAWGVHPQEGKPHAAVFELKQPVGHQGGTRLTFTLEQHHGRGHVIGRPRLSLTTSPPPVRAPKAPDAIAALLSVPPEKRNDAQKAELARHVLKLRLDEQLAALPPPQFVYAIASDFEEKGNFKPAKKPRPVEVLRRGDIRQPLEPAGPGALSCVSDIDARFKLDDPADEGSRRAALSRWITRPGNTLTWRSIVNRVWHYHFGRGIVETPNDFGRMGAPPTHPELLDWLAVTFRDDYAGSFKKLHRLIVTSSVYRQSSAHNEAYARDDSENRYLWRMTRARLDAEQVRDAVLAVSGKIDFTMGGPSVRQFVESKGVHETPNVEYDRFDVDSPGSYRRAVYRFVFRTVPDPFMETLDCPDASQLSPKREASVTALQALAMLNNRFMVRQSEHVAARLATVSEDPSKQVEALYVLALGRPPEAEEVKAIVEYASKHGMANACRMVLNSNEFMFLN